MERRIFLAIFLAFVVLYGFQVFFAPPPQERAPEPTRSSQTSVTPPAAPIAATSSASTAEVQSQVVAPEAVTSERTDRQVTVQTRTVEAVFSNRGAQLLHWRLKDYRDDAGRLLDLVPSEVPRDAARPFALRVAAADITRQLDTAVYRVSGDVAGRVDATSRDADVVFEFQDAAGLRVRKAFHFSPDGYVVRFSATVQRDGASLNPTVLWGPGLGDIGATSAGGSYFTGNMVQAPQGIYYEDGKVRRLSESKIADRPGHDGTFRFAGIDDHYFIAAVIDAGQTHVEFHPVTLSGPEDSQRKLIAASFRFAQPPTDERFFVGPKQFDLLKSVDPELVRAINFGMFAFLVVPLLGALKWLYAFVGNYGGAIILLTVLINLVMFPLRHKSLVSMRKMQTIQPQIKAIQARYADLKLTDPARQKMNTEVMNLYREHGANPASGCVPMLLTMPVLFAFYSLLQQAIELRGAPLGLWIHDLSQHDPYYVAPILMAATMWWQQKLTPTTADPAQQKMMMVMPLVFGVMFLRLPSGLAIYYLMSNLFQIGQQYFTNRLVALPTAQPARPAGDRRVKPAGAGRTAAADRKS